jgi:diaminohydroxyphosphoribosylaminopyrimidine deaminase / 5-amino-6-(5-phosphoribosylamino)uracil reductase
MKRAIALARRCEQEPGRDDVTPRVGVVIAKDGEILAEAYRGQDPDKGGDHAEFIALHQIPSKVDLATAEVFTTLEPCSQRNPPKKPCATHLIERGVGTVHIGSYDLNPRIFRQGWRMLNEAGIALKDFPSDLRDEIATDNQAFLDGFRAAEADSGIFRFDWTLNDGALPVKTTAGEFITRWSGRGQGSIYAYGGRGESVALARFAHDFDVIDDPDALPFNSHSVTAELGDIVIFRNAAGGHLLVKALEIHAGPKRGAQHFELRAAFKVVQPIA